MPGSSWRTEYWIKRVGGGHQWELYCTVEGYGRQKVLYETFNRVELMEYFSSVQFSLIWMLRSLRLLEYTKAKPLST